MRYFVLTWNPKVWSGWSDDEWNSFALEGKPELGEDNWSTGSRRQGISPGDGLFFLRQGPLGRGILAFGSATSEIFEDVHFVDPNARAWYVNYRWEIAVPLTSMLDPDDLVRIAPEFHWKYVQSSGQEIDESSALKVLDALSPSFQLLPSSETLPSEEDSHVYAEGNRVSVTTNRYERDPKARTACIRHYGHVCFVCGFDFEKVYGERGKGFIEVHHLSPLSELGGSKISIDPVQDMRPLCSNCHSMIHRGGLVDPNALRTILQDQANG